MVLKRVLAGTTMFLARSAWGSLHGISALCITATTMSSVQVSLTIYHLL